MENTDYFGFGLLLWLSSTLFIFYFWGKERQSAKALPSVNPSEGDRDRIAALEAECRRLQEALAQSSQNIANEARQANFEQIKSLLISFPTAQVMAREKPTLPAKNLTALFAPLDNLIASWGYEKIGEPWVQVPYDPTVHQPDDPEIQPGEMVYVRFVGYRDRDRILCAAKVSRTLPLH